MTDATSEDRGIVDPDGRPIPATRPPDNNFGQDLAGLLSGSLSLIKAVPTALLGFITVWLLAFFPWLRPWTPLEERTVAISEAAVSERRFINPDDRAVFTVVTFNAKVTGYAANPIVVATMWIDPTTQRRVEPDLNFHGRLVSTATTNQSVGWLDVPFPTLPAGVQSCLVVRVLLFLAPEGGFDPTKTPGVVQPTEQLPLLAYADTPRFDPFEDGSCAALDRRATPATE